MKPKQNIQINESDLTNMVKEATSRILNEIFNFKNSVETNVPSEPKNNNDYQKFSPQTLKSFYKSQNDLTPIQQKALNGAMWVRAMWANYHGYSPEWPEMFIKDGEYYFYNTKKGGQLEKVPYNNEINEENETNQEKKYSLMINKKGSWTPVKTFIAKNDKEAASYANSYYETNDKLQKLPEVRVYCGSRLITQFIGNKI